MRQVTIIATGGTIEKTYDEWSGELSNRTSIVHRMLSELRLEATRVSIMELMSKDSLQMTDADRQRIIEAASLAGADGDTDTVGIVILHGTDRLEVTGNALVVAFPEPKVPIVLTGAMRPFEMKNSDALIRGPTRARPRRGPSPKPTGTASSSGT